MSGLQDVPDHGSRVHTAADHGDEIGQENQPHPTVLPHLLHAVSTVTQMQGALMASTAEVGASARDLTPRCALAHSVPWRKEVRFPRIQTPGGRRCGESGPSSRCMMRFARQFVLCGLLFSAVAGC